METNGIQTDIQREELDGATVLRACADVAGERLDVFLARISGETRSFVQRVIELGEVALNGRDAAKTGLKLKVGDTVEMRLLAPAATELEAEDIPIDIVYEDADIAVINKARGMVVHPAAGNEHGTLVNAVMFHIRDLSGIGGEIRPGIVHRIDKLTSGLIVIAKNDAAHRSLALQMKEHSAHRLYLAIVNGNIKEDSGTVDAPIGRHPTDRKRMAVSESGRSALTHFRVLERFGTHTFIAARLETGRTHQIRVHMAHIKHPVAGDPVYGGGKDVLSVGGQALHASRLTLTHPSTGERLTFAAPAPEWFVSALIRAGHGKDISVEAMADSALDL